MSDWAALIVRTITGQVQAELPLTAAPTWNRDINSQGTGNVTVMMGGSGIGKNILDPMTEPWAFSIVVTWKNIPIQGGPIPDEQFTDNSQGTQITFNGIWALFTKRIVFPATWSFGNPADQEADVTYDNMTLRQIAKRLIVDSISRPDGYVPIVFDPNDSPGTNTRTYYGYELNLVADMLANLTGVQDGPEIDFIPRWSGSGFIQWYMRIGNPRLGQIGSSWVWDYGERGACRLLDINRNGSAVAGNWYSKGAGDAYATVIGTASDTTLIEGGFPLLEGVDGNHTNVIDLDTSNDWATALMNTYHWPTHTLTAVVSASGLDKSYRQTGSPTLGQLALGDTASFKVEGHRRILDGTYVTRIIGISNNDADSVKLTLQPTTYL